MKAIIFNHYGGPDVLEYEDVPEPIPGEGEMLIKVAVASVNPVDWKVREGRLKFMTGKKFPLFAGTELSGVVTAIGPRVFDFKPGDSKDFIAKLKKETKGSLEIIDKNKAQQKNTLERK